MSVWWLMPAALAAETPAPPPPGVCVERLDRTGFSSRLEAAESAWLDLDATAFRDDLNVLTGLVVPCLGDVVPPDLSARWHRLMALHLDGLGLVDASEDAIRAAHLLDPNLVFDDAWVGSDNHLRTAFADPGDSSRKRIPEPRVGSVTFDGTQGVDRPKDEPTLFQLFDASGVARTTRYLGPDEPLPAYLAVPRVRNRLLVSSGVSLVAGAVTAGLARSAKSELKADALDLSLPADSLVDQRRQTDLLAGVSYGFFAVAVGFGGAAVAVGQR